MSEKLYKLTPVDTWFFRDGRPYFQYESHLADIKSLFPPFAVTIVGAFRASIARGMGWNGKGDWPSEIKKKIGDGPKLGPLRFKGPYLYLEQDEKSEILVPAPLHLLGEPSKTEEGQFDSIRYLNPGHEINCDIGNKVRLPSINNGEGLKTLYGYYLTLSDLDVILNHGNISEVHPIKQRYLWDFEFVVGLERDYEKRTAKEGALYSISRVRLAPGVSLAVSVDRLKDGIDIHSTLPFGGESRLAYVDDLNATIEMPGVKELVPSSDGKIRFTVTHITPAHFGGPLPGPGDKLPGIEGSKIVSACLERPVWIGGWDTVRREPLPLKPFLPGGSTWFCEADSEFADNIIKCSGTHIGDYCEYGFGETVIGLWNEEL